MNNAILSIVVTFMTILIGSCTNTSIQPKSKIYGQDTISNRELKYIDIQDFENFHELYSKIEDIACSNISPAIQIEGQNHRKIIVFGNPCWENYSCILIRKRNVFEIKDEKIIINDTFNIDQVDSLLAKHYKNFGEDPNFSERPEKAIVSISYIKKNHSGLEDLLDNLTRAYDRAGLSDYLNIWIEDKPNIPPPPPPISQ